MEIKPVEEEDGLQHNVVNFSSQLADMLGFSTAAFSEPGIYTAERVVDMNPITAIYLYCDVIEHRTVGGTLAPLLGVVAAEGKSGAYVAKRYENIQYHPVMKKNISTIHISLRDDQGNLIRFQKGKVILTLHFQPKSLFH